VDRESLRVLLAQGLSVEKIAERFDRHPTTVSYWMRRHGLQAVNRDKYAAKGGIEREPLKQLIEGGASIRQIADELGLSAGTVRHWLRQYGLKTHYQRYRRSPEEARSVRQAGLSEVTMICAHHGETRFVPERGHYRCKRCRSEAIARRRRRLKEILVAEAGGRCSICGYDRSAAALHLHHPEPGAKRMPVSARGVAYSLDTLRAQARKCVLLCSNCHAEVENGLTTVSVH
jgi:transposase-like protein